MDQKTFYKELKKSLQHSEDWHLTEHALQHRTSGIYMLRSLLDVVEQVKVRVTTPQGGDVTLGNIRVNKGPYQCYQKLRDQNKVEKERAEKRKKEYFLNQFSGFQTPEESNR